MVYRSPFASVDVSAANSKTDQVTNFDAPSKTGYSHEYSTALVYPEAGTENAKILDAARIDGVSPIRS
jgi:hypothetical protein